MDRETSEYAKEEYKKVIIMENNTFMMPPIAVPKFILRSTGEEVEVIGCS